MIVIRSRGRPNVIDKDIKMPLYSRICQAMDRCQAILSLIEILRTFLCGNIFIFRRYRKLL